LASDVLDRSPSSSRLGWRGLGYWWRDAARRIAVAVVLALLGPAAGALHVETLVDRAPEV